MMVAATFMEARPAGTVTFLFTDIQGSTNLWEHERDRMKDALLVHDEILRTSIEREEGYVFKTVGDAFCAAFHTAVDAVHAALHAQITIAAADWDLPSPLRVRMGIHTGEAVERDGDYFGPAVNRAARLEAAAHGGQTIMSLVTAELVRDALPDTVSLEDLGAHRLKDLIRHERVFQLYHPDLDHTFPPIRTLDRRPNNLPVQPTPLVGRKTEVEAVQALLVEQEARLVSLVGIGGIGKTRLALQVAADMIDLLSDGAFFVDLSERRNPDEVVDAVAESLSLPTATVDGVVDHLKRKELCLVLDNFEQIIDGSAIVADILAACPRIMIIVTTREALRIRGEHLFSVPPLSVPDTASPFSRRSRSGLSDAVSLFLARALDVDAGFSLADGGESVVAEICERLEGIPLAVELAAARVRLLSPQELLARLDNRLAFLTRGARDLPERQRALRTTLEWSYDLLEAEERVLFSSLAVFAGGFDLDAVESVCGPCLEVDVLDVLESLVDKNLVRAVTDRGNRRFSLMELVREYAAERLSEVDEERASELLERHTGLFEQKARALVESPRDAESIRKTLGEMIANLENLRSVESRLIESDPARAIRFELDMVEFRHLYGAVSEGVRRLRTIRKRLDRRDTEISDDLWLTALEASGRLAIDAREYAEARRLLEQALGLARSSGSDPGREVRLLHYLGWTAIGLQDPETARKRFEETLNGGRVTASDLEAMSRNGLGYTAFLTGETRRALEIWHDALSEFEAAGYARQTANVAVNLSLGYARLEDLDSAISHCDRALTIFESLGSARDVCFCLNNLGDLHLRKRGSEAALEYYTRLVDTSHRIGSKWMEIMGLAGVSEAHAEQGRTTAAGSFADEAVGLAQSETDHLALAVSHRAAGRVALMTDRTDLAIEQLDAALVHFEAIGDTSEFEKTLRLHPRPHGRSNKPYQEKHDGQEKTGFQQDESER